MSYASKFLKCEKCGKTLTIETDDREHAAKLEEKWNKKHAKCKEKEKKNG